MKEVKELTKEADDHPIMKRRNVINVVGKQLKCFYAFSTIVKVAQETEPR